VFGVAVAALLGLALVLAVIGWFNLRRDDIPYETLEAKYATAESEYAALPGGVRVHFRDEGNAKGPTLLLVHGFSASLHTWEPWVQALGADYRIVSLDLPGHGLTRAPKGWAPSMEAYRDTVEAFARARGLTRFTLVGQSMGGNVAWEYALKHPERVTGLVLVGASGWPETRPEYAKGSPLAGPLSNPAGRFLLRDLDSTALVTKGLKSSFENDAFVTDAMVTRYVELGRAPGHRDAVIDLALDFHKRNPATAERLAALSTPTLILHGEKDLLVPVDHARKFDAAIPDSTLIIYPATGHILNEEQAARSAADLNAWLKARAAKPPKRPTTPVQHDLPPSKADLMFY